MAAALQLKTEVDPSEPTETPTVPGSIRAWRTVDGVRIGTTGRMVGGGYWSRAPNGDYRLHAGRDDASLALTLVYMRGRG